MNEEKRGAAGSRSSERDREAVIDRLSDAFADDRLGMEEFERRLELAHRAETSEELTELLADLPREAAPVARRPDPVPSHPSTPRPPAPVRVPEKSLVAGVLGGGDRSGGWVPARNTTAIGVMGGVSLDLRESPLASGVTEIECYTLMGGIDIIAPPGVHIECNGIGFLGGFEYRQEEPPMDPDAPVLRISGFAVMGGVSVSVREPGESAGDAKRRRRALRKERRRALRRGD
ncbi:MAG TPA: DUF1707 domain-containing protein [Longimicrobiales bacterium]|nr:DUF1707 domain-containing protein [Longimicrobiales bacterium]